MSARFTQRDLQNLLTAVNMIAAGPWDEGSYGERPDWEALEDKLQDRIKPPKPTSRRAHRR